MIVFKIDACKTDDDPLLERQTFETITSFAPVAQLDRVLDYESRGREFESSRVRHYSLKLIISTVLTSVIYNRISVGK